MPWNSRAALALALSLSLAGCASVENWSGIEAPYASPPSDQRPSDEPLLAGKQHFARADYGLAEKSFRAAVEVNAKSIDGWVGLAASYDRLHRFDLADRAYQKAVHLAGHTPELLNNLGYHYLLMGDRKRAREHLLRAAELDPGNAYIRGNLRLVDTWSTADGEPERR